jgi:hypothetical protein
MFEKIRPVWTEKNPLLNTAAQVARTSLEAAGNTELNGKAFYVAGGDAVDIDDGIQDLEPQWLGQKRAADLANGQQVLGLVCSVPDQISSYTSLIVSAGQRLDQHWLTK